jgi:small subunit ribosomal protein S20
MANTRSAKKMIRKIDRQTAVNRTRLSRIRSFVRKVEEAIQSGDRAAATAALKAAEPEVMKGASKNIFHANAASRKISRLTRRVQAMA